MATIVALFEPTQTVVSTNIYEFLHLYDRSMFAVTCKLCLSGFIKYLQNLPHDEQLSNKSYALRQFILRPGQDTFYPMIYLNELKKIGAVLYPSSSPEFVGKLRKAFYEEDKVSLKVLIDFGVDASKIIADTLRKNLFCNPDILNIVFSSKKIDFNYNYYRGCYPLILASIWLDKITIWDVLKDNIYNDINWNYADSKGRNLAYWSSCCRTQNALKYLRICYLKNVNMDKKDDNGNRAVTIAVSHRKLDVLKYLVDECKVDVNEQNATGSTIAHDVCERAYPLLLKYLLNKGLRLDIKNNNNETAIDHARMYYSQDIIDVLIAHNLWNE